MPRPPLAGVLAVVAALLFIPAASAAAQGRPTVRDTASYEVSKVLFQGNRVLGKAELRSFIATEPTRCKSFLVFLGCLLRVSSFEIEREINRLELARDMVRIRAEYFRRGYRSATADTSLRRRGDRSVEVTFVIDEGEPTRIASLEILRPAEVLSQARMDELVQIRTGQPVDLVALDTASERLRNALWQEGYSDAVVTVDTSQTLRGMEVLLTIDPRWQAHVGDVQISGNVKVETGTIRNSMLLEVGRIYRRSDLERSQRALYESGLFQRAQINVVGDSLKSVIVEVDEAKLRHARVGAGVSTVDFFQLEGQLTNFNWMGGARRANVSLAVGNLLAPQLNGKAIFHDAVEGIDTRGGAYLSPTWRASAELRIPWFQSPRNEISLSGFAQRRSLPGIFVDRSIGFNSVFTREMAEGVPVSIGYQYELTRVDAGDLYFCVNFAICDPGTIAALQSTQSMSPLTVSTTIQRTDDPVSPRRGSIARVSLEHASSFTLSAYRYNRVVVDAAQFFPLFSNGVLGLHARAGWVGSLGSTEDALGVDAQGRTILHPRKRFFAGGSQSVRGFGEAQLGPRILTVPGSVLTDAGCTINEAVASCDEAVLNDRAGLPDTLFTARPLGGNLLAEGSVEYRFPLLKWLGAVLFVDGALVGESGLSDLQQSTVAVTPGFGFRYASMAGPIRIDFGFNPFLTEDLPVVTNVDTPAGSRIAGLQMVRQSDMQLVAARRTFTPPRASGLLGFLSRFTLHLSIGQAF